MVTFCISLIALVLGYLLYGRFVDRVFGPDDRVTPAIAMADGVDHIVLPNWKVFIIQFLNIAGTGPIFGAIMGAKFGPVAYLWIVLGCIFAGSVHDYFTGMLSMRNGGASCPEIVGKYLGDKARKVMLVFSVLLLLMVGTVFVFSPATILQEYGGTALLWIICIFVYYIVATMLPIDEVIGRFYPMFAIALLFMVAALMVCLFVEWPQLPELWSHPENMCLEWLPCYPEPAHGPLSGFRAQGSCRVLRLDDHRRACSTCMGCCVNVFLLWGTCSRLSVDRVCRQ